MDPFAAATDALFADLNIARDALWRAGGAGDGVVVRVIIKRPDQAVGFGDSRAILPTMLIDVRRSEVSDPASGDTVEIDGAVFEVLATPVADSLGLVWTCETAPPP
ncbi:MAG: hypothetical protein KIT85_04150 [Pseudolabrys sp.]|jgi:hypothetical protein|nr:hypothetical protein [Pseudolabrys sp.]